METREHLKAKALSPDTIGELILEWDTSAIIQHEVEYRMSEDDDIRRKIERLKRRVYREELPALIDERIEKAHARIKEGMKIPERFQNPDGSLNEEAARKELRKGEQKAIRERIKEQVEKEVFPEVCDDYTIISDAFDYLTETLTEEMKALKDYNGEWYATVSNFGWREMNGEKKFPADCGQELLHQILPRTECTYRIFKLEDGSGFSIQNFHHDSPTGNEWYKIVPYTEED